jgi:hypothetical protein
MDGEDSGVIVMVTRSLDAVGEMSRAWDDRWADASTCLAAVTVGNSELSGIELQVRVRLCLRCFSVGWCELPLSRHWWVVADSTMDAKSS